MYQLNFENLINYDSGRRGISVDVRIEFSDAATKIEAKIDTGSESCIFARSVGEQLGLDIEAGELSVFGTVTGTFRTYGHWVTLVLAGSEFYSFVFFAENESFNRNVLGRHGFLDRFIIGINDYDGKFYLNEYE